MWKWIRLKSLLPTLLLFQFLIYICGKILNPVHSTRTIEKMHAVQHYIREFEEQVSMQKLEADRNLAAFLQGAAERSEKDAKVPNPSMIIVANEGTFSWIRNFVCSVAEFNMLTRLSIITTDHDTTLSIGLKFPMLQVYEMSFNEISDGIRPKYDEVVRHRVVEILRLRIGAMVAKKEMDAIIAAPNQVWTNYLLNRTLYRYRGHQNREGLLVQQLSAQLLSRKFTSADSALTYACDVPRRYMCHRMPQGLMVGTGWFRDKQRTIPPDIVHIPMSTKKSALKKAGLWLLSEDGNCIPSVRENLSSSVLRSELKWKKVAKDLKPSRWRYRFRPPHSELHRTFLEEPSVNDMIS